MFILVLVVLAFLFFLIPKGFKYVIMAPIVGIGLGGSAWAVTAFFFSSLVSWVGFGGFLLGGILVIEALALYFAE